MIRENTKTEIKKNGRDKRGPQNTMFDRKNKFRVEQLWLSFCSPLALREIEYSWEMKLHRIIIRENYAENRRREKDGRRKRMREREEKQELSISFWKEKD